LGMGGPGRAKPSPNPNLFAAQHMDCGFMVLVQMRVGSRAGRNMQQMHTQALRASAFG
jgi:hypothetical protein